MKLSFADCLSASKERRECFKKMSDIDDIGSVDGDSSGGDQTPNESQVQYPLTVLYCGSCGLPPEYCEFDPKLFESSYV